MLSVPGIFKDGKITLLQSIPNLKQARVIVTILDAWSEEFVDGTQLSNGNLADSEIGDDPKAPTASWLGSMAGTAEIVGDIVSPLEEFAAGKSETATKPIQVNWLGCMAHTLVGELGDIVSPMEDTWSDWEVLRA